MITNGAWPTPVSKRRIWLTRAVVFGVVAVFGAWMAAELRPLFQNTAKAEVSKPESASLTQPEIIPPTGSDASTSLLGTDSSASRKPLQLVLVRTTVGRTLEESTASLGADPRNPQTYAGGAVLVNGARIEEIRNDRVVLRLGAQRSELLIGRHAARATGMNEIATRVGGTKDSTLDRIASSREDLSAVVRPMAVFENDKLAGYKLVEGTSSAQFSRLGLESGDVLRSVEGRPIVSDAAWTEVDDAISAGASIVVGIERHGSLTSMTLDGSQLLRSPDTPQPIPNDFAPRR
jgi:hypothetical protein